MKILVIRRGALGDVVHVAQSMDMVLRQRPEIEIHLLTDEVCFPLLHRLGPKIQLHGWPRNKDRIGYQETLTAGKIVRAGKFDLIVNLMPSVKSNLISWYGRSKTVKLEKQRSNLRGAELRQSQRKNVVEEYYEVFQRVLDLVPFSLLGANSAERSVDRASPKKLRIALVVGVANRRQNKAWSIASLVELSERLLMTFDCEIVLIGGPEEKDCESHFKLSERVLSTIGGSLEETFQHLAACDLAVGCDTGPSHMASAIGVPVVMCFGPTFSRRTGPLGKAVIVEPDSKLACWPCENRQCNLKGEEFQQCMKSISVEEVFGACQTILETDP